MIIPAKINQIVINTLKSAVFGSYGITESYGTEKHKTTGFEAPLISLLYGTPVWISGLLPGKLTTRRRVR